MNSVTADALEIQKISSILPASRNPRTHSQRQIEQIAASIKRFGFINPVLVDDNGRLLAGHGRIEAAKLAGFTEVPCLKVASLSDEQKRAYVIADNRLAEKAGWDRELLALELADLTKLGFEVELTGFELPEIDLMLTEANESSVEGVDATDECPPLAPNAVTKLGDRWNLGRHVLVCGDAKNPDAFAQLMGDERANMFLSDVPYNVKIQGHVSGLGKTQHREFAEASGEMSREEFTDFLSQTLSLAAKYCRDGAIAYTFIDWRHLKEIQDAGEIAFTELKNVCVWNKTNAGMGTFYRSQHELIFVWKICTAAHVNNFGLGDKGRYRTNVWTYAGVNTFKAGRMEELSLHPTVKPTALVADAIRDVSHRGHIVLDPFGGSGTTLIAAEKTGRCARLIELDPFYCDVTIRRWKALTGKEARLASNGESFEEAEVRCSNLLKEHEK